MRDESVRRGKWRANQEPDWAPLEKMLPLRLCGHSSTRRYFHLDDDGAPYRYVDPDLYVPLRHYDAVELVFTPTWLLHDAAEGDGDLLGQALTRACELDEREYACGVAIGPV